eukprot:TRINITY_DN82218_c0_g1_i1.p1 TRINITY_DN82218_c0_g1~~TRINITY_DN82218_c0_g1_i1.p1  ORF type:complete len:250 (-),score=92.71 TRINITY_DN82218_c0_g1_i1:115-864(-)
MGILEDLANERKAKQMLEEARQRASDACYLYKQMNFEKAVEEASHALRLDPTNPAAWGTRGAARRRLEDNKGAISDYNEALRLDPSNPTLWLNRGVARRALGDESDALKDFNKALQLDPESSNALTLRGSTWLRMAKYDKATEDISSALQLDPRNIMARRTSQGITHGLEKEAIMMKDKRRERLIQFIRAEEKREKLERRRERLEKERLEKLEEERKEKKRQEREDARMKAKQSAYAQKMLMANALGSG